MRRGSIVGLLAAPPAVAALAGCGGPPQPRVSSADANAIHHALGAVSQPVTRMWCSYVGGDINPDTVRVHGLLLRIARKNPEATLPSPDFEDVHPPMRTFVAEMAEVMGYCVAHVRPVGAGWRLEKARLDRAVAAMARRSPWRSRDARAPGSAGP